MLKLSENREVVKVVEDQYGTPTSAEEVTKVIDLLIELIMLLVKVVAVGMNLPRKYLNYVGRKHRLYLLQHKNMGQKQRGRYILY